MLLSVYELLLLCVMVFIPFVFAERVVIGLFPNVQLFAFIFVHCLVIGIMASFRASIQ